MVFKYQYKTESEKVEILNQNQTKYLQEEQNTFGGNFLIFSDAKPLENQLSELKEQNLILMDSIATLFETVIGGV